MNLSHLLSPLSWTGIAIAILCGFIIGLDRQISGKPVGIRTCCLISLGTYTFVCAGQTIPGASGDVARIVGQIITGIGFLGAGVILTREGLVIGVTSAAVIWILAGIGMLIALEKYTAALLLSLLVVLVLRGVTQLEKFFRALSMGVYSKFSKQKVKTEKEE